MIDITLAKAKYRNPNHAVLHRGFDPKPEGTRVFRAGKLAGKSNNSGKKQVAKQGTGHRRRSYMGAVA